MARRAIVAGIAALGVAAGLFSLHVARSDPSFSFAGSSAAYGLLFVAAGWTLVACGIAFWLARSASRFGPLIAAAGFAWFISEWGNPGSGSPLVFTIGLCLDAACPPLVGHAVLAFPGGRLPRAIERGAIAASYVGGVFLLGVLPALLSDPSAQGCNECPRDLVAVAGNPDLADHVARAGVYFGFAWAAALALLMLVRLVGATGAARRARWPLLVAGGSYLGLVATMFAASFDSGVVVTGTFERRVWLGEAALLVAVAAAVAWSLLRARRARSAVARLVVDLAQSPPPGGLRDVLARLAGDPGLTLAYPLADSGRLLDADGRTVEPAPGRAQTTLIRDGRALAVLEHAPGLLADEQLVDEVTAAAQLALENERLQAEVRSRLAELRASRARIVDAGDAERRRLERDLHDGAQQRLVGLSLSLRLARSRLELGSNPAATDLDRAEAELRRAIADLRELAHGIFPVALADEGLAAALEELAEDAPVPMRLVEVPDDRYAPPVESAAYTVAAEVARTATSPVTVRAEHSDGKLVVEVRTRSHDGLDLVALEDRVGALDGRLVVSGDNGADGLTIRAELPCA
jgi:signal transduction histidine kinase